MIELKGKYNSAKIFTDNVDSETISQIISLLNQESIKDSQIRIMPDTHAGAGCVIGTTMTIKDKVIPNLVGVDIGCGMLVAKLKNKEIDLEKLDKTIRKYIPAGMEHHNSKKFTDKELQLEELKCKDFLKLSTVRLSVGTLGGGNHFIELDKDEENNLYLVIHTGSRNLGKQVAEHYQKIAYQKLKNNHEQLSKDIKELVKSLKEKGKEQEIEKEIEKLKNNQIVIPEDLAYVINQDFDNYIHDMKITQNYAIKNRETILNTIVKRMELDIEYQFETIHNYIDMENMILRKGSVSAEKGEKLIIPINMRDGSLICIGKGNEDWNRSAPHGAGRLYSRKESKEKFSLEEFKETMESANIYSTSISLSTIDECPMAYKPMEEIIQNIEPTVDIISIIKPIYNFKA